MKPSFSGVVPPMVTPLRTPDSLDVAALERLIEHLISGRVSGLFILGTTGEGPSLSHRLRRELIDRTCRHVAGRVPVLVGVSDSAFYESMNLAKHSADAGAQAVVAAPPYYFPSTQDELLGYFTRLATQSPLPLLLYNMPKMTKASIAPETVRGLRDHQNIVGIKDSSGDLDNFGRILPIARERPDWTVLIGPESLLAETVARGGNGGINGGANLCPRLFVDLYEAAARGDQATVSRLQDQVTTLGQIYRLDPSAAAFIKGIKTALALRGICSDVMAEPFTALGPEARERIARVLLNLFSS
jgi:2-dehydro-3-deoxy-D-pentonate aldolase